MKFTELNSNKINPELRNPIILSLIEKKNYLALESFLSEKQSINFQILAKAIEDVDIEALKIILGATKLEINNLSTIDNCIKNVIDLELQELYRAKENYKITYRELKEIKSQMIQELSGFKINTINSINSNNTGINKISIDQNTIEVLAQYCSQDEYKQFIEKYNVNTSDFEDPQIPSVLFNDTSAVVHFHSEEYINALLNRTYIKKDEYKKKNDIIDAYENLWRFNETKKLLSFVARNLKEDADTKILFIDTKYSHYNPVSGLICITLTPTFPMSIESVLAHEFSHFAISRLYGDSCLPFSIDKNLPYLFSKFKDGIIDIKPALGVSCELLETNMEHMNAATSHLKLACELISHISSKPLLCSYEYADSLKSYSILPLFYLNSLNKFSEGYRINENNEWMEKITNSIIASMLTLDVDLGLDRELLLGNGEYTMKLKYLLNNDEGGCLYKIKKYYGITDEQEFFLERVGDLVMRDEKDMDTEYMVRYHEFAIMNNIEKFDDPRIMESLKQLGELWNNHNLLGSDLSEIQYPQLEEALIIGKSTAESNDTI